jgi:HEAT repeat protein
MANSEKAKAAAALLGQLQAAEPETRWRAATNIAQVPTQEVVRALAVLLYDPEPFVRWAAAQALGDVARRATDPGVPVAMTHALLQAVAAENADARAAAADAIAAWGRQAPLEPALSLSGDREAAVRAAAVRALGLAGSQHPHVVVPPLLRALEDPEPEVRRMAANAIAWCRDEACVAALRSRLADVAAVVRAAALHALARLGDGELEGAVLPLLKDPDPAVRLEAVRCLRLHGTPSSIPALAGMAGDVSQLGDTTIGTLAQEAGAHVQWRHMSWLRRLLRRLRN